MSDASHAEPPVRPATYDPPEFVEQQRRIALRQRWMSLGKIGPPPDFDDPEAEEKMLAAAAEAQAGVYADQTAAAAAARGVRQAQAEERAKAEQPPPPRTAQHAGQHPQAQHQTKA